MGNKQLVLAFFQDEAAADSAVDAIKQWDKATPEIKLGAIGILVKDAEGKVKTHKLGKRKTGTGAVLFGLVGLLSGGITVIGGALLGGIFGSFFRKGLGMSKEDIARLSSELDGGKAAVAVLVSDEEVALVTAKMTELGGVPETHAVSEETVAQVSEAVEEAHEEAPEAAAEEAAPAAETTDAAAAPVAEATDAAAAPDEPAAA